MTHLNAVNIGMNKYCGPAVLSILTGKSTDECARVISSVNGKYTIEGVKTVDLLEAASRMGFDNESVPTAASLFGTLIRLVNSDGLYIVTVTGHFIAIEVNEKKIYFCDNHTKEPMPAASSARLQQRCVSVHKVFKRREPVKISSKIIAKRASLAELSFDIIQQIRYDIPKHDRDVFAGHVKFNTQEELNEFIDCFKEYL